MGNSTSVGYRLMHQTNCVSYGLVDDRETVRLVLKSLDPEGVQRRSNNRLRKHKYQANGSGTSMVVILKPFGFCIHGTIEGYSRLSTCLEVDHSNN